MELMHKILAWVRGATPWLAGAFVGLMLGLTFWGRDGNASRLLNLLDLSGDYGQNWAGPIPTPLATPPPLPASASIATYIELTNTYFAQNQFSLAIQAVTKLIELDAGTASYYRVRGTAYLQLKNYDRAMEDFNKAIQLDPNDASAYQERGLMGFELNNYARAEADFSRTLALNPNQPETYYDRSILYMRLLDYPRAFQDLSRIIAMGSAFDDEVYFKRGQIYLLWHMWEASIADNSRIIDLRPSASGAHYNRAVAEEHLGLWLRAADDFQQYVRFNPNAPNRADVEKQIDQLRERGK